MQQQPEFRSAILEEQGSIDSELIQQETIAVAQDLVARHPEIGALLLECTDLPPYANALRSATQRPVFDCVSLIRWAASAVRNTGL